jgi:hypothetical protein
LSVTLNSRKRDIQQRTRDKAARDILARARPTTWGCHSVTRDTTSRDVTQPRDSDTPTLALRGVTITLPSRNSEARRLAADPRFAAIVAGLPSDPFGDPHPDPETLQADAERAELQRQAAQRTIDRAEAGHEVDPTHLAWCRDVVATIAPLQRPLGTGEPA